MVCSRGRRYSECPPLECASADTYTLGETAHTHPDTNERYLLRVIIIAKMEKYERVDGCSSTQSRRGRRISGAYVRCALNAAPSFRRMVFMHNDICMLCEHVAYGNHLYSLSRALNVGHDILCADEIAQKRYAAQTCEAIIGSLTYADSV